MGITVLKVVQGRVPLDIADSGYHDSFLTVAPVFAFMAIVLLLGLYIPAPLRTMIDDAIRYLGNGK